jgi:C-terminal processing protease CtpA/Prc
VLIGARSFSASTVFASTIKCFRIGTLVGEETPDPATLYADTVYSELPNSELHIAVASKCMIAACGGPDGRGVIPDFEVRQNRQDTAKGIDTVLQFTLDLIRRSSNKPNSTPDK